MPITSLKDLSNKMLTICCSVACEWKSFERLQVGGQTILDNPPTADDILLDDTEDTICCILLGEKKSENGWENFWKRHDQRPLKNLTSGSIVRQWGLLSKSVWGQMYSKKEIDQCLHDGIRLAIAVSPRVLSTSLHLPFEFEMLDMSFQRDIKTAAKNENKNADKNDSVSLQVTIFVRTLVYSLMQNGIFKRLRRKQDIPHEFFTGKNNCRFCTSHRKAIILLNKYICPSELIDTGSLDVEKLARFAHALASHERLEDIPPEIQRVSAVAGSGYLTTVSFLLYFDLTQHYISRSDEVAIQILGVQLAMTQLSKSAAEPLEGVPPAASVVHAQKSFNQQPLDQQSLDQQSLNQQSLNQSSSTSTSSTFLLVFQTPVQPCQDMLLAHALDERIGVPKLGGLLVDLATSSHSLWCRINAKTQDKLYTVFDIRQLTCGSTLEKRLASRIKKSIEEFQRASVSLVVLRSHLMPDCWDVLKIPLLSHIKSHAVALEHRSNQKWDTSVVGTKRQLQLADTSRSTARRVSPSSSVALRGAGVLTSNSVMDQTEQGCSCLTGQGLLCMAHAVMPISGLSVEHHQNEQDSVSDAFSDASTTQHTLQVQDGSSESCLIASSDWNFTHVASKECDATAQPSAEQSVSFSQSDGLQWTLAQAGLCCGVHSSIQNSDVCVSNSNWLQLDQFGQKVAAECQANAAWVDAFVSQQPLLTCAEVSADSSTQRHEYFRQ
jgi:hypothetical protein